MMTMTVLAGICEILFSFFQKYLRRIFTPAFIGLIVLVVGYILGTEGFRKAFDVSQESSSVFAPHCLNALITLGVIMGMSIWGKGIFRLMSTLIGVLVGSSTAVLFGLFTEKEVKTLADASFFAFPSLPQLEFKFLPLLAIPFLICAITAALRVMGTVITSQQINDADWKRPDFASIRKGIFADGIGLTLAGILGAVGLSASPSSVGVSKITGATRRYIAFVVAGILFICAFIPKIAALFLLIPMSVAGSALMINGSFMILAGIKIITSRNVDTRVIYILGISILVGLSKLVFPQFYTKLPPAFSYVTDSVLSLTTVTALILTLLLQFRLKQRVKPTKTLTYPAAFRSFLLEHTKALGPIPPGTLDHCTEVTESLLSELQSAGIPTKTLDIHITYDQTDLTLALSYSGTLIKLDPTDQNRQYYLEEEAFASGLSRLVQGPLPDHYSLSTEDGTCRILLKFFS